MGHDRDRLTSHNRRRYGATLGRDGAPRRVCFSEPFTLTGTPEPRGFIFSRELDRGVQNSINIALQAPRDPPPARADRPGFAVDLMCLAQEATRNMPRLRVCIEIMLDTLYMHGFIH